MIWPEAEIMAMFTTIIIIQKDFDFFIAIFSPQKLCFLLSAVFSATICPARHHLFFLSGERESNPRLKLGKLLFYHLTTPANACSMIDIIIIYKDAVHYQCGKQTEWDKAL